MGRGYIGSSSALLLASEQKMKGRGMKLKELAQLTSGKNQRHLFRPLLTLAITMFSFSETQAAPKWKRPPATPSPSPVASPSPVPSATPIPKPVVAKVVVTPATANVAQGGTLQFTAEAFDSNGSKILNLPEKTEFYSLDPNIATVGVYTGLAQGKTLGTVKIRAWMGGIGGDGILTVADGSTPKPTSSPVATPTPVATPSATPVATAPPTFGTAELPREYLNTMMPVTSGATIEVPAGGSIQAAVDQAQPGDTIVLQAGATYSLAPNTSVMLRNKPCSFNDVSKCTIVIRTSQMSGLPPEGTRVNPAIHTAAMPKILINGVSPAFAADAGAQHYRLVGLEIAVASNVELQYVAVLLASYDQTSISQVPHHIVIDRNYIHAHDNCHAKRGIQLDSAYSAVVDSYISEFHGIGQDTQAIAGWNGPGPFKIVNNYLEGSGENVMFGGADPAIVGMVPSDIEFRDNYLFKPLSWREGDPSFKPVYRNGAAYHWTVKNLFELKNAQRILVEGNRMENNWTDGQTGTGVLLTVRNDGGQCTWCVVQDVTFRNNVVSHSGNGMSILGIDYLNPTLPTKRVVVENNLFEDLGSKWGGRGTGFMIYPQIAGIMESVRIDHNTVRGVTGSTILFEGGDAPNYAYVTNFSFSHNLADFGEYGIFGSGSGGGDVAFGNYTRSSIIQRNGMVQSPINIYSYYTEATTFPDVTGGRYVFCSNMSDCSGVTGIDGKPIGADPAKLPK
jgi:hypothetical protein